MIMITIHGEEIDHEDEFKITLCFTCGMLSAGFLLKLLLGATNDYDIFHIWLSLIRLY